ncbi:hypothetical protein [Argonema galeatum]|uniref:hypothetical protein n=1 Tax=Argonema galeatum TaxID=2942762 RepID=UPI002011C970|nr:hypothetical protein [Argonema galeatum]MCL1466099.1 hypothetical protein [Argonema galeatum A003/A1]
MPTARRANALSYSTSTIELSYSTNTIAPSSQKHDRTLTPTSTHIPKRAIALSPPPALTSLSRAIAPSSPPALTSQKGRSHSHPHKHDRTPLL